MLIAQTGEHYLIVAALIVAVVDGVVWLVKALR